MFYPPPIESQFSNHISAVSRRLNKLESMVSSKADSSVLSRVGANLVTNGTGLLATNRNFSGFEFDSTELQGGLGSFKSPNIGATEVAEDAIPVDAPLRYNMNLFVRNGATGGAGYVAASQFSAGLGCYDADELLISHAMFRKYVGSTDTYVTQNVAPGDTHIYVNSAVGWSNNADPLTRHIVWYGYTNSYGYTYHDYTYSRTHSADHGDYRSAGTWAVGGISGNTITLTEPWPESLGEIPAGTKVRNTVSNYSDFLLFVAQNQTCPNAWTYFAGDVGYYNVDGIDDNTLFPYGTTFVKPVLIANQGTEGATWYFNKIGFSQLPSATPVDYITASEYAFRNAPTEFTLEAIQVAIDGANPYETLYLPEGTYTGGTVSAGSYALSLTKPLNIVGGGKGAVLQMPNTLAGMLNLNTSDVEISNVEFSGVQYLAYNSGEYAINLVDNSQATRKDNIYIHDCKFYNWGHTALRLEFVDNFNIVCNEFYYLQRGAIVLLSAIDGLVHGNHVHDMNLAVGNPNHYPIMMTRDSTLSLANAPRSENIVVSNNKVEGADWEGIETHGGKDLLVIGNIVRDCKIGIAMVPCPNASSVDFLGPVNCNVIGNVVDSQVTDGSKQVGIKFVGPTNSPVDGDSLEFGTGVISGNIVIGHGTEDNENSGAIQFYGTKGLVVSNNTIVNPSPIGISAYHTNTACNISNNTIIDVWSNGYAFPNGIAFRVSYNEGFIGGNVIDKTVDYLPGKTYYMKWGIYSASNTTNKISWGQNRIAGYTDAETYLGNTVHTHGFTGMNLVANDNNPMFGLGRATAVAGFPALTNATTGTVAFRTLEAGTGVSIAYPDGAGGNPIITATGTGSPNLTGSTGIVVQTSSSAYTARTITGTAPITVTNGSGTGGNPSITYTPNAWTSFTPGWYAVTTNPALGDAATSCLYKMIDSNTVRINVLITFGASSTYGTGNWWFEVPAITLSSAQYSYGEGMILDSSAGTLYRATPAVITANRIYLYSGTASTLNECTATYPFTWASGDSVRFSITARV